LSVLKRRERNQSNRTQHGLSRLTTISDAGSTPAASTILRPRVDAIDMDEPAWQFS
jgi:hypothetical protein